MNLYVIACFKTLCWATLSIIIAFAKPCKIIEILPVSHPQPKVRFVVTPSSRPGDLGNVLQVAGFFGESNSAGVVEKTVTLAFQDKIARTVLVPAVGVRATLAVKAAKLV